MKLQHKMAERIDINETMALIRIIYDIITDDNVTIAGSITFPSDTLEWRAAEYDISHTELDLLLDIVLYEPWIPPLTDLSMSLHDAPTIDDARAHHLYRIYSVKDTTSIYTPDDFRGVRGVDNAMRVRQDRLQHQLDRSAGRLVNSGTGNALSTDVITINVDVDPVLEYVKSLCDMNVNAINVKRTYTNEIRKSRALQRNKFLAQNATITHSNGMSRADRDRHRIAQLQAELLTGSTRVGREKEER